MAWQLQVFNLFFAFLVTGIFASWKQGIETQINQIEKE
jgi:hypothetical protein